MEISGLTKAFAKAVGGIALAATAGVGAAAGLPPAAASTSTACVLPASALSASAPATHAPSADTDIEFNFITPLFTGERHEAWMRSNELSLLSEPDMIKITANTPQAAIDQVVSGVKESITKNGGSLNRIVFAGDDGSNMIINPVPNAQCSERLDVPEENARFSYTKLTDILHALLALKNQDFPGHKAGEPLAKAVDISGCNMFAANNSAGTRPLPAREISQLAGQLNMPLIASVTSIGYEAQYPVTGVFWAFLPNGNVSRLPGPYYSFDGEDIAKHESWASDNGFTIQNVEEPVKDHPFSVVNTPDIASTAIAGAGSTFVTLQAAPQTGQQRMTSGAALGNAKIAAVRKAGPGIGA
jgi:hypothetical protein